MSRDQTLRRPGVPPQRKGLGPNGKPWCRGRCGGEVLARGSKSWCSRKCQEDAEVRGGWNVRDYVFRRDKGICATCGCDASAAQRVLDRLREASAEDAGALLLQCWRAARKTIYEALPALWESNHKIPIAEGGSGTGLADIETLCRPCHIAITNEQRARSVVQ